MGIVDKLTPHPPQPEPGVIKKADGTQVVAPASAPLTPKEALTAIETELLARAKDFIGAALKRHGIGPSGNDIHWLGAEVADFVLSELERKAQGASEQKE